MGVLLSFYYVLFLDIFNQYNNLKRMDSNLNIKPVPIIDCHQLGTTVSFDFLKDLFLETIVEAKSNNNHYLQIIVGKGLHSENNEPVLIYRVRTILNGFVDNGTIKNYVDNTTNGYLIIYF
ncbi:MAG: hypothetical protein PHY32_02315 [Candidatus Pacebacteria bacterium]|nr:hypothetical protein [Candidatus Paceibacterota bacterium]